MKKIIKENIGKIFFIIFLIILIPNIIDLGIAYYELEYKKITSPQELYILDSNGEKIPLVLVNYTIINENETKVENVIEDYKNYEFNNEGILLSNCEESYIIKCDNKVNFENVKTEEMVFSNNEFIRRDEGTVKENSYYKLASKEPGEYLNLFTIYTSDKSFYATYMYKELVIDNNTLIESKEYLGTKLIDADKINNIMNKIQFASFLNKYEIIDKKIILEYDLQLKEEQIKSIAKVLYVLIDDLEEVKFIVNEEKNIKTEYHEDGSSVNLQNTEYVVTIDEFKEDIDSIEKIREYISKK